MGQSHALLIIKRDSNTNHPLHIFFLILFLSLNFFSFLCYTTYKFKNWHYICTIKSENDCLRN